MENNLPLVLTIFFQSVVILLCLVFLFRFLKLYTSKTHLESAFDSVDEPMAIIGSDYTLQRVNQAYAALTGRSYADVLGEKCHRVLRNRSTPCEDCRMLQVFQTDHQQFVDLSPHPRTPGDKFISLTFYPFHHKKLDSSSVVEHIRDITELEKLKSALEEKNRTLEEATATLRRAQDEIQTEIELARRVQQGTLSRLPTDFSSLRIAVLYEPVETIGGDLYDFIPISPTKLGIFIGDVSGHGLSSAFVSTISKMLLGMHANTAEYPAKLLNLLNKDLLGTLHTGHYLTCVWAVFDAAENSLTYARAGHPLPILLRAGGEEVELSGMGTFNGIIEDPLYEDRRVFLDRGDRCVFVTDGLYDVFDRTEPDAGIVGYDRFKQHLIATKQKPFDETLPTVSKLLSGFSSEDDCTLIAFEVASEGRVAIARRYPGFTREDHLSLISARGTAEMDRSLRVLDHALKRNDYSDEERERLCSCTRELMAGALALRSNTHSDSPLRVAYSVDEQRYRACVVRDGDELNQPVHGDYCSTAADSSLQRYADDLICDSHGSIVYFSRNRLHPL